MQSVRDTEDSQTVNEFVYDDEGQQIQKDNDLRTFDTRHRLTSIKGRNYQYDGNNNRLVVQKNGQTFYYIYDAANNLLAETNAQKEITRYFVHANGLNQMIQNSQTYTYHFSAIGHTLAMTDQAQDIQNQYAYSPFGRVLGFNEVQGLEQPFKYVGRFGVQHEQNELYYMRARYYDAETGRFLKEDPIGFQGGLNVSLYVGGNPIAFIDKDGNIPLFAIIAVAGGAVNAGFEIVNGGSVADVGRAFVTGTVATGVGLLFRNSAASGAASGFISEGLNQFINDDFNVLRLATGTIAGAVAGPLARRLAPNKVGRPAGLGTRNIGVNAQNRIRQEGLAATNTSILGGTASGIINVSNPCFR